MGAHSLSKRAAAIGVNEVLHKPLQRRDLAESLARVLERVMRSDRIDVRRSLIRAKLTRPGVGRKQVCLRQSSRTSWSWTTTRRFASLLEEYFAENALRVSVAASGGEMSQILRMRRSISSSSTCGLAGEDGMAIARTLREESAIPIIMLTGVRDEADRVMGLELGADDYLTKPFSPRELLARIRTVLRRTKGRGAGAGAGARGTRLPVRRVRAQPAHAAPQATRRSPTSS